MSRLTSNGDADPDLERRPARSLNDTAWARARVQRAKATWQRAALQYGETWARGLKILFSDTADVLRLVHADDGAALEELRAWIANGGAHA